MSRRRWFSWGGLSVPIVGRTRVGVRQSAGAWRWFVSGGIGRRRR